MDGIGALVKISSGGRFAWAVRAPGGARLLGGWTAGDPMTAALPFPAAADLAAASGEFVADGAFRYLPPLSLSTKVICLGLNYADHVGETGEEMPENPALFLKLPDALVGHAQPLVLARVSKAFDFEGEIAVVIGRGGRHIAPEAVMDHIYGFTALMDGSLRDYQQHSATAGKCFHASGAVGPWIVAKEAIADLPAMTLETRLNGERVQFGTVAQMIYDIPTAISYISRWTPLAPGDIISTGTPSGVGAMRQPPMWMKPGDRIAVAVSGVGTLENAIIEE
jgi:2-keto-4-pentenoate hydratase/2-oxohepta-3-ene-1,7-dioic acid hydratase in catechol pathway